MKILTDKEKPVIPEMYLPIENCETMRAQIRIVSGSLRGRKLACVVSAELRPTPDKVREALFSILGNAVPGRAFVDVFAGTGIMGMEALSRGASQALFVERDVRLAGDIERPFAALQGRSPGPHLPHRRLPLGQPLDRPRRAGQRFRQSAVCRSHRTRPKTW